jgi:ATP-dependent helicase/nuclease subunit A
VRTGPITSRDALNEAALNPRGSAVVEACAGSGKTWLLVSRMLRLLIDGAAPSHILAITFTRKAAQEMRTRLMSWLELLAVAPDEVVRGFLRERAMSDDEINARLPAVRGLFAQVAFATPGVTISTFHGWFQQLLAAAPLGFGTADSSITDSEHRLFEEAWLTFAEGLNRRPESEVAQSLHRLFADQGLFNTRKLLREFIRRRAEWHSYARATLQMPPDADQAAIRDAALSRWQQEWQFDPDRDPLEAWWETPGVESDLRQMVSVMSVEPKAPKTVAEKMAALDEALGVNGLEERHAAIVAALFTKTGTPVKLIATWAEKTGLAAQHARTVAHIDELHEALVVRAAYALNRDALTAGLALSEAYQALKTEQRQLDYVDLEWRAFELLHDSVHAETLQYRLDCRYRHILLDEFQDTNPVQWATLTAWLDASVAAHGEEAGKPTVFMVGDPKQAIYRFRRTDARLFDIARGYFCEHFRAADCRLNETRRNAPAIIDVINQVFGDEPLFSGFETHTSAQAGVRGAVLAKQAFPVEKTADGDATPPSATWRNPLERPRQDETADRFAAEAEALAQSIREAVGKVVVTQGDERAGKSVSRRATYRDVLVLFRRRAPLPAFESALRAREIPYVSARPGGLMDALEVQDLVALLTFLATPDDNLALAHVLKSPLFMADESDLLALRFADGTGSWWSRLRDDADVCRLRPVLAYARARFLSWLDWMDTLPVHDLLDRVYHDGEVRSRYAAAVPEPQRAAVLANLDAFMALALEVDSGRYPSLMRFLDELKRYRDLPDEEAPDAGAVSEATSDEVSAPDAVRMMTIHAAKGLEAPIVYLIDAADNSSRNDSHTLLIDWAPGEIAPRHFSFLAGKATRGRARQRILDDEEQYAARERLNLLYVAATRARQYLVVSGTEKSRQSDTHSWLDRVLDADGHLNAWPSVETTEQAPSPANAAPIPDENPGGEVAHEDVPLWSQAVGVRTSSLQMDDARQAGIDIHAALEWFAAEQPGAQARPYEGAPFAPAVVDAARRILESPSLRRFFDATGFKRARNEVEIATESSVMRIDRLVEFADETWVLDYKTGQVDAAAHHLQVRSYCDALASLYPGQSVRGALIDRDGTLIEVR